MTNLEKAKLLEKMKRFMQRYNINITSCGCCGGLHIEVDGDEILEGDDFNLYIDDCIKHYKERVGKIDVIDKSFDHNSQIEFIKDGKSLVNLGGRSHPFMKYVKHMEHFEI